MRGLRPNEESDAALMERLGHPFANPRLLAEALTHSSLLQRDGAISYERLEFLGDRVLGLVVAELLYRHFPGENEGALAKRFAVLVRREALAEVARSLELGGYLRLAPSEEAAGGRDNPATLADACEAVIGALYLDGGFAAVQAVVTRLWQPLLHFDQRPPQDPKTALQEWAQGRGLPLPRYRETTREGPPHEPVFTVEVTVVGAPPALGSGRSKREAERAAAAVLLEHLEGLA